MFSKIILSFVAFLALFNTAKACSCIPLSEIKEAPGCPERFISVLTIDSVIHEFSTNKYNYRVVADITPKMAHNASIAEYKTLWTADNGALCGVHLDLGETYMIFGSFNRVPRLVSCGSIVHKFAKFPTMAEANEKMEEVFNTRCVKH